MIFTIDYKNFVRKVFPWFLRGNDTLSLLGAFIKPLQDINASLVELRDDTAFKLAFNSQIIYLEQYLNTVYPNGLTYPDNIHILDGANIQFDYLYNNTEAEQPVYLYNNDDPAKVNKYFENYSEQVGAGFAYIVRVPLSVQAGVDWNGNPFNETVLRSQINFYNQAGKKYDIQYF